MKHTSLKDYSLDELRDEVERREEEEFLKDWNRKNNHFEKKCKHCENYNPILRICTELNVKEDKNGYCRINGYAWDFSTCNCFVKYEEG